MKNSSWINRLGIRKSLLLGFGSIIAVVIGSVMISLVATKQIDTATTAVVEKNLPQMLRTLSVARASDSLVAASVPLISITERREMVTAFKRLNEAQQALRQSLEFLDLNSDSAKQLLEISVGLREKLSRLQDLTEIRIRILTDIHEIRKEFIKNQQNIQQELTHRVRVLNGDGDVMRILMTQESPPKSQITRLALDMVPKLPISHFYAEVAAIHSGLQAVPSVSSLSSLELLHEKLRESIAITDQLLDKLPEEVKVAVLPSYEELKLLVNSSTGVFQLRRRELAVLSEISELIDSSHSSANLIDVTTTSLVQSGVTNIELSAANVKQTRTFFITLLIAFTVVALLFVILFIVFYVDRILIKRLSDLASAMIEIANGQYKIVIPQTDVDELGKLAEAVGKFRDTAVNNERREAVMKQNQADLQIAKNTLEYKTQLLEQANVKLSHLTQIDSLTGLANRRKLDEVISSEWKRANRDGSCLTLLMIDIDYFKQYNDIYGHQLGDECLRLVAKSMEKSCKRSTDLCARYGGEEFCIVLPNTTITSAEEVCQNIIGSINELLLEHEHSPTGFLSVSIGVATIDRERHLDHQDLVRDADTALYKAKKDGRDQFVIFSQ